MSDSGTEGVIMRQLQELIEKNRGGSGLAGMGWGMKMLVILLVIGVGLTAAIFIFRYSTLKYVGKQYTEYRLSPPTFNTPALSQVHMADPTGIKKGLEDGDEQSRLLFGGLANDETPRGSNGGGGESKATDSTPTAKLCLEWKKDGKKIHVPQVDAVILWRRGESTLGEINQSVHYLRTSMDTLLGAVHVVMDGVKVAAHDRNSVDASVRFIPLHELVPPEAGVKWNQADPFPGHGDSLSGYFGRIPNLSNWFVYWCRPVKLKEHLSPDHLWIQPRIARVFQDNVGLNPMGQRVVTVGLKSSVKDLVFTDNMLQDNGYKGYHSMLSSQAPVVVETKQLQCCVEEIKKTYQNFLADQANLTSSQKHKSQRWHFLSFYYPSWAVHRNLARLSNDYAL